MPAPEFTPSGVLPPFKQAADGPSDQHSPYEILMAETVKRFGWSRRRLDLLAGLIRWRDEFRKSGGSGFQWIGGSFVENVLEPSDMDVITFYVNPAIASGCHEAIAPFDLTHIRTDYGIDMNFVSADAPLDRYQVKEMAYWLNLFSHRRMTGERKGILQVDITNSDHRARDLIEVAIESLW